MHISHAHIYNMRMYKYVHAHQITERHFSSAMVQSELKHLEDDLKNIQDKVADQSPLHWQLYCWRHHPGCDLLTVEANRTGWAFILGGTGKNSTSTATFIHLWIWQKWLPCMSLSCTTWDSHQAIHVDQSVWSLCSPALISVLPMWSVRVVVLQMRFAWSKESCMYYLNPATAIFCHRKPEHKHAGKCVCTNTIHGASTTTR